MKSIPKELLAPLDLFRKLENCYLSEYTLQGWEQCALNFEIIAKSPIYKPMAEEISKSIADSIIKISHIKRSQFKFPKTITKFEITENEPKEFYNEVTLEFELRPDFSGDYKVYEITDDVKKVFWEDYRNFISRFKSICNNLGFNFESSLTIEFVEKLSILEIKDKPFFGQGCRDHLIEVLIGEFDETKLDKLKIEIEATLGQAAYVLGRLIDSGKVPIMKRLLEKGVFVHNGKVITKQNSKSEKSKFIKSKYELKNLTDIELDELLKLS